MSSSMQLLTTLIVGSALACTALWHWRKNRNWGFQDLVRNPKLWDQLGVPEDEMEQALAAARRWSDAEVDAAVHKFVFKVANSDDAWAEKRMLHELGSRTHPNILAILRDV